MKHCRVVGEGGGSPACRECALIKYFICYYVAQPCPATVFHGPPDLGGGSSLGPPRKNFGEASPPPPQKDGALTSCGGANGQFLPQNQGKNGQIFPLAPKAVAEFLKEPTIVFKLAQICVKTAQKRKKLLQKCPWGRKASIFPQKRPQSTLKQPCERRRRERKFFPKTCPPQNFYLGGGARPPRWRDPYMKH